jgi:hypothetical protein
LDDDSVASLKKGILDGLANRPDLVDAATFFGFAEQIAEQLTSDEALRLLNFALSRFEEHSATEYGDGAWGPWLNVPDDIPHAVTGLIWSALGSPHSSTRWEAAHCVRRLARSECTAEIAALLEWMKRGELDAFGSNRFPFYKLHARQYLLIALARVALDQPSFLKPHSSTFSSIALEGLPHILIQKYAAETALSIERAHPNTYTPEVRAKLEMIGKPAFGIKEVGDDADSFNTPWHERGEATKKATDRTTLALLNEAISTAKDIIVIRRLVEKMERGLNADEEKKTVLRKHLEETINKLDAFYAIAIKVRQQFKNQLDSISPSSVPPSGKSKAHSAGSC